MSVLYFRQFPSGYYSNRNPLAPPIDRGEDIVIEGLNKWHTEDLMWKDRPGFSRWSNFQFGSTDAPKQFYPYFNGPTACILADCVTTLRKVTATSTTTVYTKPADEILALVATDKAVYFASANNPRQKMLSTGTTTKAWAINTPSVTPTRANQAGTLDAVIGYRYKYCYYDSTDGHYSNASSPSASTGAQTNQDQVVTVRGTTQARVDKIRIFRTKDGGSTFYYLNEINNPGTDTNTTYTDSTVDSSLNTAIPAPGRNQNSGPNEPIQALCLHQNRIWTIYTITATGATAVQASTHEIDGKNTGVIHESFPEELSLFSFPGGPSALISSTYGLLVFTVSGPVYLIQGQSKYDFVPAKILDAIPIKRQQNMCQDGDTIYAFTTGKDIVRISQSSGIDYIGTALSSTDLSTFDPSTTTITVHRVGRLSYVLLSNGATGMFCYNLKTGTWSTPWAVSGTALTAGPIMSLQTSAGTYDVLLGPKSGSNGYIWKMDETAHRDDGSETYATSLTFGNFMIANPTEMADLEGVVTESIVQPTVTILMNEISGAPGGSASVVNEPALLDATTTYVSKLHRFDLSTFPQMGRHLRIKMAWSAANEARALYSFGFKFRGSEVANR